MPVLSGRMTWDHFPSHVAGALFEAEAGAGLQADAENRDLAAQVIVDLDAQLEGPAALRIESDV